MKVRIIGDVHGKYGKYLHLTDGAEYSIQLGDMGFSYNHMKDLNPLNHTFFGGNHDNYDKINTVSHCHGNFGGRHLGNSADGPIFEYFIVRGAYSVDKKYRTIGIDWWAEEELNRDQAERCIKNFAQMKPEIVISHDCPASVVPEFMTNDWKLEKSFTGALLDVMFEVHRPKLWIFGHHHQNKTIVKDGTKFICLDELSFIDLDTEKEL